MTVAARDANVAAIAQQAFATSSFRVYTHDDMIGVQLGGSMKNYIAIAAGMIDGANLGLNIRAALITRGLAEMQRLGVKMGANPHTFSGLSGLGDLVLTCTGNLSRNHTVGMKIGQGMKLRDVLDGWRRLCVLLEPLYGADACRESLRSFRRAHGLGTVKFLAYRE